MLPQILWCHLVIRGVGWGWVLLVMVDRHGRFDGNLEVLLLLLLVGYASAVRAVRPFINEIVLLERNPLTSHSQHVTTVGRRSQMLHGGGGQSLFRWLSSCVLGVLLTMSVYGTMYFVASVARADWSQGALLIRYLMPLAMWIVAGFFTVFRFLSYLDARIRQEGWEVELHLRAEAARMAR